jgi:hypothetical protein
MSPFGPPFQQANSAPVYKLVTSVVFTRSARMPAMKCPVTAVLGRSRAIIAGSIYPGCKTRDIRGTNIGKISAESRKRRRFQLRSFYQRSKDCAGSRVVGTALWMPLHRKHKMIGRSSFESFDDSIFRTARHHSQPVSHHVSGLMMAGIYRDRKASFFVF